MLLNVTITSNLTRDTTDPNWASWTPNDIEWAFVTAVAGKKRWGILGALTTGTYATGPYWGGTTDLTIVL
jgi:hypothetical protein